MNIELKEIIIYPIKSCKGIVVNEFKFNDNGLLFDRELLLIDNNNKIMNMINYPILSSINLTLNDNILNISIGENNLLLDLLKDPEKIYNNKLKILKNNINGKIYDDNINLWFSNNLNIQCKLLKTFNNQLNFKKDGDILLISEESFNYFNNLLTNKINYYNFRPNIIIKGIDEFKEDKLDYFILNNCKFKNIKKCRRCSFINVNSDNGNYDKEIYNNLSRIRKIDFVFFGILIKKL